MYHARSLFLSMALAASACAPTLAPELEGNVEVASMSLDMSALSVVDYGDAGEVSELVETALQPRLAALVGIGSGRRVDARVRMTEYANATNARPASVLVGFLDLSDPDTGALLGTEKVFVGKGQGSTLLARAWDNVSVEPMRDEVPALAKNFTDATRRAILGRGVALTGPDS